MMTEKWNTFRIIDAQQLFKANGEEIKKYKFKRLNAKQDDVFMFSKKDFELYRKKHNVLIVGSIRKRQRRFKTYEKPWCFPPEDYESFVHKKQQNNIIGTAEIESDDFISLYDVRESNHQHTIGYACIGKNKFLQVTAFNPLLLLPLLLIICLVLFLFHDCSNSGEQLDIVSEKLIETADTDDPKQLPNCDYLLFSETLTLTEENQYLRLCNLKSNEGLWLISYQVYIDDKPLMRIDNPNKEYNTGAIKAGYQIDGSNDENLNLWERLDAGTYELKCVGTQYCEKENAKGEHLVTPVKNTLKTKLIIEK